MGNTVDEFATQRRTIDSGLDTGLGHHHTRDITNAELDLSAVVLLHACHTQTATLVEVGRRRVRTGIELMDVIVKIPGGAL